jgi:polysaccharide export outer membrane protein
MLLYFCLGVPGAIWSSSHALAAPGPEEKLDTVGRLEAVEPAMSRQDYVLGAEDLLDIEVVGVESLSRTVRVSEAGEISLPLLGEVRVAGLTRTALERSLAARLEERYVHDPQVTVFVREHGSKMVSVLGAVEDPGRYPMTGRRTLLDMISEAGGLTDEAGPSAIITHRSVAPGGAPATVRVDLHELLYGDRPETNPEIVEGDMIHIPVDLIEHVYVNGAVNSPGELEVRRSRPLTILQAITKAGGTTERAALKKVELLRRRSDGSQEIIPVDMKAILNGQAEDFVLLDGDVVHVPETYF